MQKRFTEICEAMHARTEKELGFEPSHVTVRALSVLTGHLRAFVESTLGKGSNRETRSITKFPHHLFTDYRPDGALYNMLCVCLNFKYLHGLRRIEFSNIDKRGFNFDLLGRIEKSLKQARLLPLVKVYFSPSLPKDVQPAMRAIVTKRGAVVSTASAATHVVYPDPPGTTVAETAGTDYCRPLKFKDATALVHWWYYPDSYDSWISRADVDGEPDPPEDQKGPWHVQMRWLEDTDLFNEWMNPADYEISAENRISITSEDAHEGDAVVKGSKEAPALEKHESPTKISKKRKRMSPTKPESSNATSQKDNTHPIQNEMDLDDTPAAPRKQEKIPSIHRDVSSVTNDGAIPNNSSDPGKESAELLHHRKKPRLSDEGKKGSRKQGNQQSVKVRLSLKAPKEKTKSRSKERVKDDGKRDEAKTLRKEVNSDSRSGAGLKVKMKLSKPSQSIPKEANRIESKVRDSDNDDAISTQGAQAETALVNDKPPGRKAEAGGVVLNQDNVSPSKSMNRTTTKVLEKSAGDRDGQVGEGVLEHKRPFSRRRSKKKERMMDSKIHGVTVVENALPIPEGNVPRIRNISNQGTDSIPMKSRSHRDYPQGNTELSDSMVIDNNQETGTKKDKGELGAGDGENRDLPLDAGTQHGTRRIVALSEKMLDVDDANAPASGADLLNAVRGNSVRMPAHSQWFRTDAIHDIEKRSLPEFFNHRSESKTPMVYKKYRDFMIDVWRQAPERYVTATSIRRHLAGDVCAILRVHAFLEHWGLINYGTEPESKPFLGSSIRSRYSRPKPIQLDGHTRDSANGVSRLLFFDEPKPQKKEGPPVPLHKAVKAAKEKSGQHRTPLLSRRELYATAAATKYECDGCGSDCSRMRYHCVGNADIELCPSCFANGMYPETLSARDFEQLTTVLGSEAHDGSVWSEAEVLLLLEGLEKFGDDWSQISDHVGTKTKEQCVLQFLRMPIEDSFLGDQLGRWETGQSGASDTDVIQGGNSDGANKFAGPLLPFADTANPVMAQVAFLASSVSPEVAAAAAQAALHALMSESNGGVAEMRKTRTAQAQSLLNASSEEHNKAENRTSDCAAQDGSKLNSLPRKQLDAVAVEAAAAVGLAAAVTKAKTLADAEGREIERAFAIAVESKLRVVDMKLQELDRLEQHMRRERDRLEKHRQTVYADRVDAALMRTAGQVHASRVAAAHEAAANVAAGLPLQGVNPGPAGLPSGGGGVIGGPQAGTVAAGSAGLMSRPGDLGMRAVHMSVDNGAK